MVIYKNVNKLLNNSNGSKIPLPNKILPLSHIGTKINLKVDTNVIESK